MKQQVGRTEIKNVHGRQMGSSKTQHVSNYKSDAKSKAAHPMHLRSTKASKDLQHHNLSQMAQKAALSQRATVEALTR